MSVKVLYELVLNAICVAQPGILLVLGIERLLLICAGAPKVVKVAMSLVHSIRAHLRELTSKRGIDLVVHIGKPVFELAHPMLHVLTPLGFCLTLGIGISTGLVALGFALVHAHVEPTLSQRDKGLTYQQQEREYQCGVYGVHA